MLDAELLKEADKWLQHAKCLEASEGSDNERGSILFWRATAALLVGDVEGGFMLMQAAYRFDASHDDQRALTLPAARFALLDPDLQALKPLTEHYLRYVRKRLASTPDDEPVDVNRSLQQWLSSDHEHIHANHVFQLTRFVALADKVQRTHGEAQRLLGDVAIGDEGLRAAVQAHVLLSGLAICESWGIELVSEASTTVTSLPSALRRLVPNGAKSSWDRWKSSFDGPSHCNANKAPGEKTKKARRAATIAAIQEIRKDGASALSDLKLVYVLRNHHAHSADPLPETAKYFDDDVGAILRTLFRFIKLRLEPTPRSAK